MLTEVEYRRQRAGQELGPPVVHPLCAMVRELRQAARLSLHQFEECYGIPAVVVGAYERGDRIPPLHKLERILACFGYTIKAVPVAVPAAAHGEPGGEPGSDSDEPDGGRGDERGAAGSGAMRLPADMVAELRAIANQLEATEESYRNPGHHSGRTGHASYGNQPAPE